MIDVFLFLAVVIKKRFVCKQPPIEIAINCYEEINKTAMLIQNSFHS